MPGRKIKIIRITAVSGYMPADVIVFQLIEQAGIFMLAYKIDI